MAQARVELVLKLRAPDGLAAGADARGVAGLDHKLLYHPVENVAVVVAVSRVDAKVFHRLRALLREQLYVNVAMRGVQSGGLVQPRHSALGLGGGRDNVLFRRFLVKDVPVRVQRGRVTRLTLGELGRNSPISKNDS